MCNHDDRNNTQTHPQPTGGFETAQLESICHVTHAVTRHKRHRTDKQLMSSMVAAGSGSPGRLHQRNMTQMSIPGSHHAIFTMDSLGEIDQELGTWKGITSDTNSHGMNICYSDALA